MREAYGRADDFQIDTSVNKALFGFGDAVCIPVISWLAENYLNPLLSELIHRDWSTGAEVVHTFKLGDSVLRKSRKAIQFRVFRKKHLLETTLDWQAKKAANLHIQAVDIAKATELSPCRVNLILRFARLHPEIQKSNSETGPKAGQETLPRAAFEEVEPLSHEEQLSQYRAHYH